MTVVAASLGFGMPAQLEASDDRAPIVPEEIQVPEHNKVHFQGYAEGFQIYTWNGASWGSAVPDATLYDDDGNVVATHFGGPTWRSNSGSFVVGALPPKRVMVDSNSIPWLRLSVAQRQGPGILGATTYIQRVNTVGGNPPTDPGTVIGHVVSVPYAADYFFYRESND
jgi:hypothetical protein